MNQKLLPNHNQQDNNLINLLKQEPIITHVILTLSLLALSAITAGGLFFVGSKSIAQSWTKPLTSSPDLEQRLESYLKKFSSFASEKQRIKEEVKQISLRTELHKTIATDYYRWLFVALPLTSGAAIISGISLFYISKEGWEKANNYIINIFISSSAIALYVGSMPVIFKIEDNAKANAGFFILYNNLENQVLTRLATLQQNSNQKTDREKLQSIINDTEAKIEELNKFSIVFDANSIYLPNILPEAAQHKHETP